MEHWAGDPLKLALSQKVPHLSSMVMIDHSPVSSDKGVLGGTLVFRGSRVPAQTLIDYLNDGYSMDEFLEFFPSVQKEEAESFMRLIEAGYNEGHL